MKSSSVKEPHRRGSQQEGRHHGTDLLPLAKRIWWHAAEAGKEAERVRKRELPSEETSSRHLPGQCHLKGGRPGKLLSPSKRRKIVKRIDDKLRVSERRVCKVLGQARMTQRYAPHISDVEEGPAACVIALATQYGRYGYRRTTALLKEEEWQVNHKKVERIWKREGLKVPQKQPKRRRLWLNDGSCI